MTGPFYNDDKPWIAADFRQMSPFRDNLYLVWTRFGASSTTIMFSRSTDQGANWSAPQAVSASGEGFVWPSHVAVAPNGDLCVACHSDTCGSATANVFVLRDSSGGANLAAGAAVQKSSFPAAVTCNVQGSPGAIAQTKFWMQGSNAPCVAPDPNRPGNVYVIANDDPNDDFTSGDPGDVVLARSTDFGNTWTESTISHAPLGALQAFPTGAIDQDGNLCAFWHDTRGGQTNANGDLLLDVYGTVSRDGGLTFTNDFRINDAAFDPDAGAPCRFGCGPGGTPTLRIGEYNGAAAADGVGYLAWTGNTFSGTTATGQRTLFDVFSMLGAFPDRFEPNDAIQPGVATDLGVAATYSQSGLTIHSDTDEDWFKVTALSTGTLAFQIGLNGRVADLDIEVRGQNNNVGGGSGNPAVADTNNSEAVTIPAVAGRAYFLRVFARPGQLPTFNTCNLAIINTAAPAPFGIVLAPGSDSGRDAHDNVTNVNKPTVQLQVNLAALSGIAFSPESDIAKLTDDTPGCKIGVFADGNLAGFASPSGGGGCSFTFPSALADGLRSITARVFIVAPSSPPSGPHAVGSGGESDALHVTIDTVPPTAAGAPDLIASSDSGGVNDDNITTITTPQFAETGEANALVRLYANGAQVGSDLVTAGGTYQVMSVALNDGVYTVTVRLEDLAGNVSAPSASLKVTIANRSLTLPGATASASAGAVTVDLAAGTVAGFGGVPGASGKIGIVGIPVVNIDANGKALTILGTPGDDQLTCTPTGANAGTVLVGATGQLLALSGVGGTFTIDPLNGNNDVVTVIGSAGGDSVTGAIDTISTVQVNGLLPVSVPTADVDQLAISTRDGPDSITLNVADTVSANLSIDAGAPAPAPNKAGDQLTVNAVSPQGHVANAPGGPTQGSGVVTVTYPKTTNAATRIQYTGVEKVSK